MQLVSSTTIAALKWLGSNGRMGFLYWDADTRTYQPTDFGKAVLASGLPPEQCVDIMVRGSGMRG